MASRSSANCGKSMCACESISSILAPARSLCSGEVDDNGDFAADQFFWLVELRDARANLTNLSANVHSELQQFICSDDAFGSLDLPNAHLDFGEVLDADFF